MGVTSCWDRSARSNALFSMNVSQDASTDVKHVCSHVRPSHTPLQSPLVSFLLNFLAEIGIPRLSPTFNFKLVSIFQKNWEVVPVFT